MTYAHNLPSVATLARVFDEPQKARNVLKMSRTDLEATAAGAAMVASCYNSPKTADLRLHVLNSLDTGLHGVEWLRPATDGTPEAAYLNAGDTYTPTLIYVGGRYRVQSVGDYIETQERRGRRYE